MVNWLAPVGIPNSIPEMLLGYGLMALVAVGYIVSVVIRRRQLLWLADQIEELDDHYV